MPHLFAPEAGCRAAFVRVPKLPNSLLCLIQLSYSSDVFRNLLSTEVRHNFIKVSISSRQIPTLKDVSTLCKILSNYTESEVTGDVAN